MTKCAGWTARSCVPARSPSSGGAAGWASRVCSSNWTRRVGGLYTVADQSAPPVQRRYLAEAVAQRFPGFSDVEYPDWRSLLTRLAAEADLAGWRGPFVLDDLPYLLAADPALAAVLQNWLDRPE